MRTSPLRALAIYTAPFTREAMTTGILPRRGGVPDDTQAVPEGTDPTQWCVQDTVGAPGGARGMPRRKHARVDHGGLAQGGRSIPVGNTRERAVRSRPHRKHARVDCGGKAQGAILPVGNTREREALREARESLPGGEQ